MDTDEKIADGWDGHDIETHAAGVVLWHRTTDKAADAILRDGFRDNRGFILAGVAQELEGVFVSNVPLDCNEGAKGDVLLRVVLNATEAELADYEIVEDMKTYREWLVPAALLNTRGAVEIFDEFADERE